MRAVAAGVTDVGREREHNEDRFVLVPDFDVYVVADGMGGHQCGEVASRMATTSIANYFRAHGAPGAERLPAAEAGAGSMLRSAVEEANRRIFQRASSSASHRGMGTTVVAATFQRAQRKLYVAHAGDSRCYRLRGKHLEQLTRDHSLVEEALRARPDMSRSELAYLPSNVITRALGVDSSVEPDVTIDEVRLGDLYLLCSDGLHGFVIDDRIREILGSGESLGATCAALVAEANKNGGGDNITAVVLRIEASDDPWTAITVPPPRVSLREDLDSSFGTLDEEPTDETPQAFFDIEDAPTEALDLDENLATQKLEAKRVPVPVVVRPSEEKTPLTDVRVAPPYVSDEPTVSYDED